MKSNFLSLAIVLLISFLQGCKKEMKNDIQNIDMTLAASSKGSQPSTSIVLWQKCIGTSANDYGFSVAKAMDGSGYFIVGTTEVTTSNRNILVAKIDGNGTGLLWQKSFGGSGTDEGTSVIATEDGGCLIAGKSTSNDVDVQGARGNYDIWLLKLTASGTMDPSQSRTLGGSGYDIPGQIIHTSDGGYLIAGQTTSNDGDLAGSGTTKGRGWVIKLDLSTNIVWQKTFDVAGSKDDAAYGVVETSTGDFALCGRTLAIDNNADIWITKFNHDITYWEKHLGSNASDCAFKLVTSQNNGLEDGFVIAGYLGTEAVAVKLDMNGNISWQKTYKPGSSMARGRSIVSTATGYVMAGDNTGDQLIWKVANDGTFINGTTIGGGKTDNGYDLIATDDGKFLSAGSTSSSNGIVSGNHGLSDMWLVKFAF